MISQTSVSFVPPSSEFLKNALFEGRREGSGAHSPNAHWLDCYVALREKAKAHNIIMNTADLIPPEQADIVVYMLQPTPKEIIEFKRQNPRKKALVILLETSLGAAYAFDPRNHESFDAVLTYKLRLVDHKKYFPMRPRAYERSRIRVGKPFAERRVGCLVGVNRKFRYRSGIMVGRAGWHFSLSHRLDYVFCPGELLTYRSRVGRLCTQYSPGIFDIYGEGWEIYPETRNRCLGIPKVSTIEYIGGYRYYFAFENHRDEESLISERIWDSLWGDAVPVYYGNPNLSKYVPKECFIDATDFASPSEMLAWLTQASEREWSKYHDAGRAFLYSRAIEPCLPEARGNDLLEPFLMLSRTIHEERCQSST